LNNHRLLQDALRDATDTRQVVIGSGALASVVEVFAQVFGDRSAVVIADENTFDVAGREVQQQLSAAHLNPIEPFIFPGQPQLHAAYEHVLELEAALRQHDAIPVVVGSGTLNDLTKVAAQRCARPYLIVATAASMDGYTSFGASITRDGFKHTLACPAPRAVVADVDVLSTAPAEMAAWGYADLLGKVTAGADWIIADTLGIEPLHSRAWPLVQDSLRRWIGRPQELRSGDRAALEALIEGLIMAGLAMQAARSSRPASGSEHQFSHLWEMQGLPIFSHGFKVGIGSLASAALYEQVLDRDLSQIDVEAIVRNWPTRDQLAQIVRQTHANPIIAENAVPQSMAKYIDADCLQERLNLARERWPVLRARLIGQLLSAAQLRDLLHTAGCPTTPEEIGLNRARLKSSYASARQIRSRYTIFDLAAEAGVFTHCVENLFALGGFWCEA
jgi:glycerol-1-phosphate dehydrogenase [NAD(P)+]